MLRTLSPILPGVSTEVKNEDLMLVEKSWVRFTDSWPTTYKWCRGKIFTVEKNLLVQMPYSYILPGNDYKDIDLSNATNGLKLYPEDEGVLYEIMLGMKPGNYLVHFYVPSGVYVYSLAETSMIPSISDATLKYLGAKEWIDSPYNCPLIRIYAIKDSPAVILRLYVTEGVNFDKVTIRFLVNKCKLSEIERPKAEQIERALTIRWYEEIKGF